MAEQDSPNTVSTQPVEPAAPEAPVTSAAALALTDLKPKMKLQGKVKRLELFGAFVDVGAEVDGLVHISQIQDVPVKNVNDALSEGQDVTVWVRKVDTNQRRLDLTMIEMPGILWSELEAGQTHAGTVVRLEKFGAFVDIGAERPGMVHVSELSNGYVTSPEEVVKVGDPVQVEIIKVNSKKKQIDLSMKVLEAQPEPELTSAEEAPLSAFEFALRQAVASSGGANDFVELTRVLSGDFASKQKKGKQERRDKRADDKHRKQQEEIFQRTLSSQKK